jgi:Arc/MetJ family transcription regulator
VIGLHCPAPQRALSAPAPLLVLVRLLSSEACFRLCLLDKCANQSDYIIKYRLMNMRITVDIDEKSLAAVQQATGLRKRSPAIRRAVADYVKDLEKKRFLRKVMEGKSDYSLSNEELEARGTYDAD